MDCSRHFSCLKNISATDHLAPRKMELHFRAENSAHIFRWKQGSRVVQPWKFHLHGACTPHPGTFTLKANEAQMDVTQCNDGQFYSMQVCWTLCRPLSPTLPAGLMQTLIWKTQHRVRTTKILFKTTQDSNRTTQDWFSGTQNLVSKTSKDSYQRVEASA